MARAKKGDTAMDTDNTPETEAEVTVAEAPEEEAPLSATTLAEMEAGRAHLAQIAASASAETA